MPKPDYFEALKNDLDFTYEDESREAKLLNTCQRAERWLSNRIGENPGFSINMESGHLLQLLFDCVRYIENGALDEFEKNYADDIAAARDAVLLEDFCEENESETCLS